MKENEDDDKEFVRKEMEALEKEMDLEVRKCPECGDFIPPELTKCSTCGYVLKPSEEEKTPEFDDKYPEEEELDLGVESEEKEESEEETDEEEEEVSITELKDIKKLTESKSGKIIAVVVILIGIISYLITPVFVGDNTLIAVAMIFGAVLIVLGGNIAYESFAAPSTRLAEKEPVNEEIEEAEEEKEPKPEEEAEEAKEPFIEELKELKAEVEPEVSKLPETPDEELVELLPKDRKEEAEPPAKLDEMELPEDEEPFRCPICKTPVASNVSECPNCGTLFED